MMCKREERPLLTAPKNEYNFIFYRTFEPNRVWWSCCLACMRNLLVRVRLSVPNPSRDHPEGWAMGFWPPPRGQEGVLIPATATFAFPALYI